MDARITCEFLGRLGNNLFEVAALVGLSEKHGLPWAVPTGYHHQNIYKFFPQFPKLSRSISSFIKYEEQCFCYQDIPIYPRGTCIKGFWQSIKYFEHCQDKVRDLFAFKYNPVDYVSIHVRHGDYLQHPDGFPCITTDYLGKAIELFREKGKTKFLVFSDGMQWCKETLPKTFPSVTFDFFQSDEFTELSLMSSCSDNIIANSTYSWWGAFMNRNPEKIIVSPSKDEWFGPKGGHLDTKDLIPTNWVQIKFR